jgi:hypothetical protein
MNSALIPLTELWGAFEAGLERMVIAAPTDEHLLRIREAAEALPICARTFVQSRIHVERIYRRSLQPSPAPPPSNVIPLFPGKTP